MVERTDIENLEGRLLKEFEKVHEEIVKENNTTQSENNTLAVWINPQFTKKIWLGHTFTNIFRFPNFYYMSNKDY